MLFEHRHKKTCYFHNIKQKTAKYYEYLLSISFIIIFFCIKKKDQSLKNI